MCHAQPRGARHCPGTGPSIGLLWHWNFYIQWLVCTLRTYLNSKAKLHPGSSSLGSYQTHHLAWSPLSWREVLPLGDISCCPRTLLSLPAGSSLDAAAWCAESGHSPGSGVLSSSCCYVTAAWRGTSQCGPGRSSSLCIPWCLEGRRARVGQSRDTELLTGTWASTTALSWDPRGIQSDWKPWPVQPRPWVGMLFVNLLPLI